MGSIGSYTPHKFDEGSDLALENLINVYSQLLPADKMFHFNQVSEELLSKDKTYKHHVRLLESEAVKKMEILGYIKLGSKTNDYRITALGEEVRYLGGHLPYKRKVAQDKRMEELINAANLEANQSTIRINNYSFRTRGLAVASLIISIIGVLYSIFFD